VNKMRFMRAQLRGMDRRETHFYSRTAEHQNGGGAILRLRI
jgi:hypothetical protein